MRPRDLLARIFGRRPQGATDPPDSAPAMPRAEPILILPAPAPKRRGPSGGDSGAAPAAAIPLLRSLSADEHAQALLVWLQGDRGVTGEILARDLIEMHAEMCLDESIEIRPWNPVAVQFTRLIGDRKKYCWHTETDGHKARLRVYSVPPLRVRARTVPALKEAA